jgi:hypothetical protein
MSEPAADTTAPARGVPREGWIAYGLAAAVILVDQLTKYWIVSVYHLPDRLSVPILPFFNLSMVWTRGVSFGMFRAEQAGFSIVLTVHDELLCEVPAGSRMHTSDTLNDVMGELPAWAKGLPVAAKAWESDRYVK